MVFGEKEGDPPMKKICAVITSRGNYAKLKSVIREIDKDPDMECQVVVGGSAVLHKYGDITPLLPRVDRSVHFLVEGGDLVSMTKSAGIVISEFSNVFESLKPDIVMIVGDRYETLPIAMTAAYMNIPIAHLEGGEVSGSVDESIRHAITKLAHIHFPATRGAAERIVRMGEDPELVFRVGSTSFDIIQEVPLNDLTPLMSTQCVTGVGPILSIQGAYLVVIQHPVTTEYEKNLDHINETIEAIKFLNMSTIWISPNDDAGSDGVSKGIRMFRESSKPDHIHFFKSLPIEVYAPLLKNAACIVGNSSVGIREAGFLGVPVVNIGTRQDGRERTESVVTVGYNAIDIACAIQDCFVCCRPKPNYLYGDGHSAEKIVNLLKNVIFPIQKRIAY